MSEDLARTIRELKDRQDIRDCLLRYCRAIDRLDRELLAACYHPGACDDHGAYVGSAEGFIDWVMKVYGEGKLVSHHEITNHLCEIDGDVAHGETYWVSTSINRAGPPYAETRGRYVDRFERRDRRWAIMARVCLVEITTPTPETAPEKLARCYYPRDRSDVSYARPLTIDCSAGPRYRA